MKYTDAELKADDTYVAPATTNSSVPAFVRLDNTAITLVVATVTMASLEALSCMTLQIITGLRRRAAEKCARKVRITGRVDEGEKIYTFGSFEIVW